MTRRCRYLHIFDNVPQLTDDEYHHGGGAVVVCKSSELSEAKRLVPFYPLNGSYGYETREQRDAELIRDAVFEVWEDDEEDEQRSLFVHEDSGCC